MNILPRLLFLFFLYLVSCTTSQEDVPMKEEEQVSIGFKTKALNSRGPVSGVSDIEEFKVYAVMSEEPDKDYDQSSDVVYNHILKDERVYWNETLNSGAGGFMYDNTQYWVKDRTFHFFGFWPAGISAKIDGDSVSYNLTYSATVATAEAKDDLLTFHSSTYVQPNQTTFEAVPVTFNRALTQISFEITQDFESNPYDKFTVQSVTFSGIQAGGTLTTSRFNKKGEWHFTNDKLSFSKEINSDKRVLTQDQNGAVPLVVFDGLNLVPQSIALNTISFVVNYTYQQGDENGLLSTIENNKATIYLPISEWSAGKIYKYKTVLYKNNLIMFSGINVSTWGEQPDAGTIIIK